MRINKFFTDNGICSRREADRWIEAGRVTINGQVAKLGDQFEEGDVVCVDGHVLKLKEKKPVIIAYNKPVGVECTSDPEVPNNIIDAVNYSERIFHIGRLDKMSEGLILLTNMGDIVNKILRRRYGHEKEYVVVFSEDLSNESLKKLARGVDIGDETPTEPCKVRPLGKNRVCIVLREGRNRQIRRMADALGLRVVRLKRVRVMNVELGELPSGRWRHLTDEEHDELMAALELVEET